MKVVLVDKEALFGGKPEPTIIKVEGAEWKEHEDKFGKVPAGCNRGFKIPLCVDGNGKHIGTLYLPEGKDEQGNELKSDLSFPFRWANDGNVQITVTLTVETPD